MCGHRYIYVIARLSIDGNATSDLNEVRIISSKTQFIMCLGKLYQVQLEFAFTQGARSNIPRSNMLESEFTRFDRYNLNLDH